LAHPQDFEKQEPGGENNLFLMVYNPDASVAGSYRVRINEG